MRKLKSRRVPLALSINDDALFLLSGSLRCDPAVERWLAEPSELRALARLWFERVRQCGKDVRELIHDGCPVACVDNAAFAYVNTFKRHVNVGFFHGATLEDPKRLLQGSGKRMRHVRVDPAIPVDEAALRQLIRSAYLDIKARVNAR